MSQPIRRVVTGHDSDGKAVVVSDGATPRVITSVAQPGLAFHEIWNTRQSPATVAPTEDEPTSKHDGTAPPQGGTVIRIVDIPPEGKGAPGMDAESARKVLETVGLAHDHKRPARPGRHPLMHRTQSIDYGIVLAGEIVLVLDEDEVVLTAGDVIVQRGTIHAWNNRSDAPCRIAFILVDGRFEPGLAAAIEARDSTDA